jgi:hypothetical protein
MSSLHLTATEEQLILLSFAQQAQQADDFSRDALWAAVLDTRSPFRWNSIRFTIEMI